MYWLYTDEERLFKAFRLANSDYLLSELLRDLFTEKELKLFAKRFKCACMILDGATYDTIREATGCSSTTISWISKKLINKNGGFQEIIGRFNPHGRRYFD